MEIESIKQATLKEISDDKNKSSVRKLLDSLSEPLESLRLNVQFDLKEEWLKSLHEAVLNMTRQQ